jgi:predicted 3-demethylubiquinone-9 3-methyltransferase (glyoxalase superfamily)
MVTFTPSFSFFITCDTEEKFDTLYQKLIDGGHALMPIGDYGFASWLSVPKEKVSKLA